MTRFFLVVVTLAVAVIAWKMVQQNSDAQCEALIKANQDNPNVVVAEHCLPSKEGAE